MIKQIDDKDAVVSLWREAFDDTEEEILFFLKNAGHAKCVGLYDDAKRLAAMLFLVECRLHGKEARYIFAACTAKGKRGQGLMTQLLEDCKKEYGLLCLIPANDSLIAYYAARGFLRKCAIEDIVFDETDEIKEYLLEGYRLTEPTAIYYEREHYGI